MKCPCLYSGALVAVLAFAAPLLAQPVTLPGGVISPTAPIFLQQIFTTGMVGFTTNQTARLNVVNLNPAPASTSHADQDALGLSTIMNVFRSRP